MASKVFPVGLTCFFFFLFSSVNAQLQESLFFKEVAKAEILDFNNRLIAEFSAIDIQLLASKTVAVQDYLGYALCNMEGKNLMAGHFESLKNLQNRYVLASRGGKWGLYHIDGQPILEHVYDSIFVTQNFLLAAKRTPFIGNWEVYNLDGRKITPLQYEEIGTEGENVLAVKRRGYWGFLNLNGQEIISCKYQAADRFFKGLAKVHYLGGEGIIDKSGEWVIEPFFKSVEILKDGSYIYRNALQNTLVYPGIGKVLQTEHYLQSFGEFIKEVRRDSTFNFYNTLGVRIGYTSFDAIESLIEDSLFAVKNAKDWYFLSRMGRLKKMPTERMQEIGELKEGFIKVKIDGKFGFIDQDGLLRVANRYDAAKDYAEGKAAIRINSRWGFIDKYEDLVIQPNYDYVGSFIGGSAMVIRQNKAGIIDAQGKSIQGFIFDQLIRLDDGKYLSEVGGKYGLIDSEGKQLIYPKYDMIQDLGNGFAIVKKGKDMGVMSYANMSIVPLIYSKLIYDASADLLIGLRN